MWATNRPLNCDKNAYTRTFANSRSTWEVQDSDSFKEDGWGIGMVWTNVDSDSSMSVDVSSVRCYHAKRLEPIVTLTLTRSDARSDTI